MKFYLAPMEGVTKYLYREAYNRYFGGIDKYFTPFISPDRNTCLNKKELADIHPDNNKGMYVVPQILTNNYEYFIETAKEIRKYGYEEINLNLGCPSGTVVAKKKGSGFLTELESLDKFLYEIYAALDMKISVKTRLGKNSPDEFCELMEIYNKYQMEELIIHPRIQTDFYRNKPNLDVFEEAFKISRNPVCYNGDIFTVKDYEKIIERFPGVDRVMLGRGIIANPGLVNNIKRGTNTDKEALKKMHDEVLLRYEKLLSGEKNVLFKMKEFSLYVICIFENNEKYAKKIKKATSLADYRLAVNSLFKEQEIKNGAGYKG